MTGGSTYCALASLRLMGAVDEVLSPADVTELVHWLTQRQVGGFQGRPSKDPDSCYSFWVGGSLTLLGLGGLINGPALCAFLLEECQSEEYGGFAKEPGLPPDLLHCYFGLCGLLFSGVEGLGDIDPTLGITLRAKATMKTWG